MGAPDPNGKSEASRNLAEFFWHPVAMKIWWLAIAIWWVAFALNWTRYLPAEETISVMLHPFALIFITGCRMVRDWRTCIHQPPDAVAVDDAGDEAAELPWRPELGLNRQFLSCDFSDSTDIRSPLNTANPLYRLHHSRR
jgi:hypothetical protein